MLGVAAMLVLVGASEGATLDAVARGFYRVDGTHDPANSNYIVGSGFGFGQFIPETRDFFIFDLSAVEGTIAGATLHLFNRADDPETPFDIENGYRSADATETYRVNNVASAPTSVMTSTASTAIFDDLGDGTSFGSYIASNADNGRFIDILLNPAALAALNAAAGGLFAFGGNLTSLSGDRTNEQVFAFSGLGPLNETQLIVTLAPVPEPATVWLSALGLLAVAIVARRRSQRA